MDPHYAQTSSPVCLVPGLQVGEGANRVGAAEVPEVDQHGMAMQLVDAQRRAVDPGQAPRKLGGHDVIDRRSHGGDASAAARACSIPPIWRRSITLGV